MSVFPRRSFFMKTTKSLSIPLESRSGLLGLKAGKFFSRMGQIDLFKCFSLSIVWVWLITFALVPFCLVLLASFLNYDEHHLAQLPFTLKNYRALYDPLYFQIFARSF